MAIIKLINRNFINRQRERADAAMDAVNSADETTAVPTHPTSDRIITEKSEEARATRVLQYVQRVLKMLNIVILALRNQNNIFASLAL